FNSGQLDPFTPRTNHPQPKLKYARQLVQHRKDRIEVGIGRVRTDPADDRNSARGGRVGGPEEVCVNDCRDDNGARALRPDVFGDEAIAASDDRRPTDQFVRLAEPLQSAGQPAITLTDVAHVSGVVQIEYEGPT